MQLVRAFLERHRAFAALLIAAALCMKALVPAGYMIGQVDRVLTVEICADSQSGHLTKQIVIPGDGRSHGDQSDHGKSDGTCAFTALAFAGLSAADPALLATALAFILLLGFARLVSPLRGRPAQLRPPLRGPPALI